MKLFTKKHLSIILTIFIISNNSNAFASEAKDHIECKALLKNLEVKDYAYILYLDLVQSVIAFSNGINDKVIEALEKKSGTKINKRDFRELYTDSHFNVQIALQLLTIESIVEQCKKSPETTLEAIGRATYLATQDLIPKHPKMDWKVQYRKKVEDGLKNIHNGGSGSY